MSPNLKQVARMGFKKSRAKPIWGIGLQPHDYISEHYSSLLMAGKFIHASQYFYGREYSYHPLLQVKTKDRG